VTKRNSDIMATALAFRPTLHNYAEARTGEFPASFGHSLSASLASTVVSLLVGVPAAYVLARWRFRGQHQVAMWMLVTRMAPPIAFTIPFFSASICSSIRGSAAASGRRGLSR